MPTPLLPRLPAEWEPQQCVLLTWPRAGGDWGKDYALIERELLQFAVTIARFEPVTISCEDAAAQARLHAQLDAQNIASDAVTLRIAPSNDIWVRDHGPISIIENDVVVLCDFIFDGWGGKYPADLDNRVTATLHAAGAFGASEVRGMGQVLEGGGIETDGAGTVLTTSSCLLRRAGNKNKDDWEIALTDWFGITRVLWLDEGGLLGDDTDGHVDTLTRFCNPTTIAYTSCADRNDPHFAPLAKMRTQIEQLRRADGQPYRLVELPLPSAIYADDGRRLPATYANFLIINGAVLVPTYGDEQDALVLERLTACFDDREVIGIDSRQLIQQNGSLHCASMQVPVAT
jgi:agmatine/peptidylarginine deiminase